ncbi:MAG: DUF5682 family protein [Propioniciclava sp.]|uniref:DUF5682 family protein n=1 Tax=Propioniciclava sp. TaxID=2038686 RepID=UPI0039E259B4
MADVHVLGVRHHGPGSARAVAEALDALRPDVVLIEGPPELDALIPLVADPGLQPPIAALVYATDDPRWATFYPLASFSPEWVAMRWASGHGVAQRFLDLPAAHALALDKQHAEKDEDAGSEAPVASADPIGALAHAAGYDDPEQWWEDAVESRAGSALERFAALREAIAELRHDEPERDPGRPDNPVREAAMRRVLREEIKAGRERIVVVCGAWHAPALVPDAFPPISRDQQLLRGLPKVKTSAAWVPWTADRLSYASGYGAGVDSPGWYRHLFEHWASGADHDPAMSWLVRVAHALRTQGIDASTASVVDASRLASALASLRGRPAAGLSELQDAALSILTDGNPYPLALVRESLVVGRDLGTVPASAPLVPLAADLATWQKATRLKPSATSQVITLDLRTVAGRARSRLLHRLAALGVAWGRPASTGRSTGTFKEQWELAWRPELAIDLVEASLFGTTIESAAMAFLARKARSASSLAELAELVNVCLLAEIGVHDVVARLAEHSARHTDVPGLLAAVRPLAEVSRYGSVRDIDVTEVDAVLRTLVARGTVGLPAFATSLDADAAAELVGKIDDAHAGLTLLQDDGLLDPWLACLALLSERDQTPGILAGRATRLLLDAGHLDAGRVGVLMGLRLSPAVEPRDAAGWLAGFLASSAVVLVHDPQLLALVDAWVAGVDAEAFDDLLPLLRRTFAEFSPPERRMLGEQVSRDARASGAPETIWNLEAALPALAAAARILWKEEAR